MRLQFLIDHAGHRAGDIVDVELSAAERWLEIGAVEVIAETVAEDDDDGDA